ncbi:MAG TPA: DGQHR domain-containing protein [Dehalococcoidia bacterium]|nr:DGQHR domain-containing protein [Dehalococcoidia bacterium]
MKVPALRFNQSGKTLYMAKMTAREIIASCHTAEWDPAIGWDLAKQGYQRMPVESHYQAIGHFLAQDPQAFMPTSALLSAREADMGVLPFTEHASISDVSFGELEIPPARQLTIVDYQHRWRGLIYAIDSLGAKSLESFEIPVTIIANMTRPEEIEQFYLINSKQKRIDTDLALALLQTLAPATDEAKLRNFVGSGKVFRIRSTRLTFALAARAGGPWAGRIRQPHDLPQTGATISITSFVDSLAPLVSPRSPMAGLSDDEVLDVIDTFWQGVLSFLPNALTSPHEYQIQRTVGTFALHLVLAGRTRPPTLSVYERCVAKGAVTAANVVSVLSNASAYLTEGFWETKGPANVYVGSSGYRELARLIRRAL